MSIINAILDLGAVVMLPILIFMLAITDPNTQINLLKKLVDIFQKKEFLKKLVSIENEEEFAKELNSAISNTTDELNNNINYI